MSNAFDLKQTYVHLDGPRAETIAVDERFWSDVISGARPLPGWLVASFTFSAAGQDTGTEVHPNGDEIHMCLSGSLTAVLERDGGDEKIDFAAGESCLVPRGTWHRLVAREPSQIVSLTFGEGTEHRTPGSG